LEAFWNPSDFMSESNPGLIERRQKRRLISLIHFGPARLTSYSPIQREQHESKPACLHKANPFHKRRNTYHPKYDAAYQICLPFIARHLVGNPRNNQTSRCFVVSVTRLGDFLHLLRVVWAYFMPK